MSHADQLRESARPICAELEAIPVVPRVAMLTNELTVLIGQAAHALEAKDDEIEALKVQIADFHPANDTDND